MTELVDWSRTVPVSVARVGVAPTVFNANSPLSLGADATHLVFK